MILNYMFWKQLVLSLLFSVLSVIVIVLKPFFITLLYTTGSSGPASRLKQPIVPRLPLDPGRTSAAGQTKPRAATAVGQTQPPRASAGQTLPHAAAGQTKPIRAGAGQTQPPRGAAGQTQPPRGAASQTQQRASAARQQNEELSSMFLPSHGNNVFLFKGKEQVWRVEVIFCFRYSTVPTHLKYFCSTLPRAYQINGNFRMVRANSIYQIVTCVSQDSSFLCMDRIVRDMGYC